MALQRRPLRWCREATQVVPRLEGAGHSLAKNEELYENSMTYKTYLASTCYKLDGQKLESYHILCGVIWLR